MKITDYTEEQIKEMVRSGICSPQAQRDYHALKQIQNGEKITHVAMDHNMSRQWLHKLKNKYTPKA